MNFDLTSAMQAKKSTGSMLTAGIHNAKFVGIDKDTITTKNGDTDVMTLILDVEGHGEYKQNFFKPNSDERTASTYGENPSQMEQFKVILVEILEALNPDYAEDIASGKLEFGNNFTKIVAAMKKYTSQFANADVQIKLLPQSNGWASIPSFPASVDRNGNLRIQTVFIGHDLTLTANEKKKIDAAANARPTNMATSAPSVTDVLGAMKADVAADLGTSTSPEDDLPF